MYLTINDNGQEIRKQANKDIDRDYIPSVRLINDKIMYEPRLRGKRVASDNLLFSKYGQAVDFSRALDSFNVEKIL